MERLDIPTFNKVVLPALLGGNPQRAQAMARKVFTDDAIFKHPFCLMNGKEEIARLYAFWARAQSESAAYPGVTQLWIEPTYLPGPESLQAPVAVPVMTSVVLDVTYQTVPYLPFHSFFNLRHSARIVVMLHCVRGADGLHRIQRQEDLIQVDSLVSALFPHVLSLPLVDVTRMLMRLSALFILTFLDPALSIVRLLFGW